MAEIYHLLPKINPIKFIIMKLVKKKTNHIYFFH